MQQRTHGMAMFVPGDRFAAQRNRVWLALAKVGGEPVGLMLYQLKGEEVTQFLLRAPRFYYHTGPGRLAIRLSDPLCPWNEGVWQLETVDGLLRVSAGERPDGDLSIQGLTALLYGTHDPGDFALRGWGNPTPAVQATMRTMFPPLLPYLHEYF
jgi:hypothetical protein